MIMVYTTGHEFNEAVTVALSRGFGTLGIPAVFKAVSDYDGKPRPCISYGILRGTAPIYRDCIDAGVEWWNVDRGFFGASRKDTTGTYRLCRNDLGPRYCASGVDTAPDRWDQLGITVAPWRSNPDGHILVCPPSDYTAEFHDITQGEWISTVVGRIPKELHKRLRFRFKGASRPLHEDFRGALAVVVYNSNVAVDALLEGLPAYADRGIVAGWNPLRIEGLSPAIEVDRMDRELLFRFAAASQFTLKEISSGEAWNLSRKVQRDAGTSERTRRHDGERHPVDPGRPHRLQGGDEEEAGEGGGEV